jgi:hypothetical protein
VHALLRVCYPAPPPGHNCGHCEKCLRTRLLYATCLPGIACATLPDEPPLAGAIDAIPRVDEGVRREVYAWVLDQTDVAGDLRRAVAALVARSQQPRKEPPP